MKKYIILIFAMMLASTAFSQEVYFDNIIDGDRRIAAGKQEEKLNDAQYEFSLIVFANEYRKSYYLVVNSLFTIDNNCEILIRLGNDEVRFLPINSANQTQIDWPSAQPIFGSNGLSWAYGTQKADYYVGLFSLNETLLNEIETHGIKKLRIKFYSTYFEKSWKKDKLGKFLKKCHENIDKQLLTPHSSSKSFYDDF